MIQKRYRGSCSGHRQHREARPARGDPSSRPRARRRARLRPREGRRRRGRALRRGTRRRHRRPPIAPRSTRLDADCVLYMPRALDLDDVVAFLDGRNQHRDHTGRVLRRWPPLGDDERARVGRRVHARATRRIYATGSSPGFITDALPFALLSMQRRVDSIEIEEFANMSRRRLAAPALRAHGVRPAARLVRPATGAVPPRRVRPAARAVLAEAAGRPVDELDVPMAKSRRRARARPILAGEIRAERWRRNGRASWATAAATPSCASPRCWYCTPDLDPAWDVRCDGMAGAGPGRCALRRRDALPGPARRPCRVHARVHGKPSGERGGARVPGPARDSLHRRPAAPRARATLTL